MTALSFDQMELIDGGTFGLWEAAGFACGAAISGLAFGGFGFFVSAAIFGPTCAGLTLGAIIRD